jgi:uncharacterized membrane protein
MFTSVNMTRDSLLFAWIDYEYRHCGVQGGTIMARIFNISAADIDQGKAMAGISYFGLPGFLIALLTSRENRFVMYHAQQSLLITILFFLRYVPFTPFFLDSILALMAFVFLIIGLINGFGGKVQPLPLLGEIAYSFGICKEDQ